MGEPTRAGRQFGSGPFSRATSLIYNLLAVELLFLLTAVPGLLPLMFLARDASNLPLFAVGAIPLGPGFSAALYALRHRGRDATELRPTATFWRGYRLNALPVLGIWLPWLALLTIVGINLAYFTAAGVPRWWAGLLVAIAAVVTLWMVNALVITSLFTFRVVDVARLARYFLGRTPGVTVGNTCLLIVAVTVTALFSEVVLMLLASALALGFLRTAQPMIDHVEREFTA